MKRIELLNLPQVFEEMKHARSVSFAYGLMKNRKLIDAEKENLAKTLDMTPNYQKFLKEVQETVNDFCEKENNNVITFETVKLKEGKILEDFKTAIYSLREIYATDIESRRKDIREYQKFIRDDVDFDFYRIAESSIPTELKLQNLIAIAELINFKDRDQKAIEFTNYQLLTYIELYRNIFDLGSKSSVDNEARNKMLINFVELRKKHSEIYKNSVVQDWLVYEEKRKDLAEKFAETDIYGDILIQRGDTGAEDQFVIKDIESYNKALEVLSKEFEMTLNQFYSFLENKTKVNLSLLKQSELPEDMTLEDLQTLDIFIENE